VTTDLGEKIRRRAYELWERGGHSGNAEECWFQAEAEVRSISSAVDPGVKAAPSGIGKHTGKCFCGAVEVVATGDPLTMGYCHCTFCRQWSASPVNAFTIWVPEAVRIIKGAENVRSYQKSKRSVRKWCQACGGHLLTERPLWLVTEVPAAVLPSLPFKPAAHLHYAETVLHIRDGLPKHKDFRAELGGSGELLDE
jgi:hypothetical protein